MVDASKNVDDYRKDQSTCQGKDHRHFPFLEVYPIRQLWAHGLPISITIYNVSHVMTMATAVKQ